MSDFTELVDLAAERLGGAVLWANDEFFAPKENLLKAAEPVFVEGKYTEVGKWMDGWETRRHRSPDHDWCVIKLGLAGIIRGVVVDTAHFKGNFPEACAIEACAAEGDLETAEWFTVLARSALVGDAKNRFTVDDPRCYTHLRLRIFPDGGVARLRVYGEVVAGALEGEVDLAAIENGGRVVAASDMFFGSRHSLILPGPSLGMFDGWETRRRRGEGHDWVRIRLAGEGVVNRVEVDTSHFKGNFPEGCSLEVCDRDGKALDEILPRSPLRAHTRHGFDDLAARVPASHVCLRIYPDGGVARLRLWGSLTDRGLEALALKRLNSAAGLEMFLRCCGSRRWAERMAAARPFASLPAALEVSDEIWNALDAADWMQAFAAHPRIGERTEDRQAAAEQAGAAGAAPEVAAELARLNQAYERRFGHIYIVCAAGKSAAEMLEIMKGRLGNDPAAELGVAAQEQREIARLRLRKI